MAYQNVQKAAYLKAKLKGLGINVVHDGPTFNEFVIQLNQSVKEVNEKLLEKGFIGGYELERDDQSLEGQMLLCVTEVRTKEELDAFASELGALQ
jgi:glycine dehydrogenase subunit 1